MNQNLKYASEAEYDEAIRKAQKETVEAVSAYDSAQQKYADDPEIAKLQKELANLKKPHEEKLERLNEKLGERRRNLSTLQAERKAFIETTKVKQAEKKGEMWEESVEAFLNLHKIKQSETEIKFKKELSNGIKVYQEKSTKYHQWNKLFLFKGTDLVGFWRKRGSEHPGDNVYSQAWIGVKTLTVDEDQRWDDTKEAKRGNDIQEIEFAKVGGRDGIEKHFFYRKTGWNTRTDPTMNQFMRYAENFKGDLVAIDVTDEETREILHAEPY